MQLRAHTDTLASTWGSTGAAFQSAAAASWTRDFFARLAESPRKPSSGRTTTSADDTRWRASRSPSVGLGF